jgi:hypothetical protein
MRRKSLPFFLVLFTLLLFTPQFAHATSQYVGYPSSALGGSCGTNCEPTGATTNGVGEAVQAPFTGQLASVSLFAEATPDKVVILISSSLTLTSYSCGGAGTCAFVNTGQSMTVADIEVLSGLTATSFNTITLASPVSVTANQWIAIVFMLTTSGSTNIIGCACASGAGKTTVGDTGFTFGTTSPSGNYNTAGNSALQAVVGGTFQTVGSPAQFTTQCYGNCGTPAITLTNTNATRSVNWNQSITLFYQFTANANGFVQNVTVNVASNQPNNGFQLGLYLANCQAGQIPFSQSCPGFLQQIHSFGAIAGGLGLSKGRVSMATNLPILNGQVVGISVSGNFKATNQGLDLNGTNTNVAIYQTNGRTPGQISFSTVFDPASAIGLWAWATGNVVTTGPGGSGGFTSGGGCLTCGLADFINALGGGTFGAIIGFGIIFSIITGGLLYATRIHHPKSQGGGIKGYGVPMELLTLIFVLMLIGFSAAGALPPWIPFVIIALVAFLFTQAIWGHRRGTSTSPVSN